MNQNPHIQQRAPYSHGDHATATATQQGTPMQGAQKQTAPLKEPPVYIPGPSPLVNETPEARAARHRRRFRQVKECGAEALPEIAELLSGDRVIAAPPQGAAQ